MTCICSLLNNQVVNIEVA